MSKISFHNPSFQGFIDNCDHSNRKLYNIYLAMGLVFVFLGLLLLINIFYYLFQKRLAVLYLILYALCFFIIRPSGELKFADLVPFLLLYLIGCVHVNLIFNYYEKIAVDRISRIVSTQKESFDYYAEQGVLYLRVLNNKKMGIQSLKKALDFENGNIWLIFVSTLNLLNQKEFKLAGDYIRIGIKESPTLEAREDFYELSRKYKSLLSKKVIKEVLSEQVPINKTDSSFIAGIKVLLYLNPLIVKEMESRGLKWQAVICTMMAEKAPSNFIEKISSSKWKLSETAKTWCNTTPVYKDKDGGLCVLFETPENTVCQKEGLLYLDTIDPAVFVTSLCYKLGIEIEDVFI